MRTKLEQFILAAMATAVAVFPLTLTAPLVIAQRTNDKPDVAEATAIAKEAFIYGYPLVEGYRTMFQDAIYRANPQFLAPINKIAILPLVPPPETIVLTTNTETVCALLWADLRAEPLVLGVPKTQTSGRHSIQFIDLYNCNFACADSSVIGNEDCHILLTGPNWKGAVPIGISNIIHAETDFILASYRTRTCSAADVAIAKQIQAGYTVQPLSQFMGQSPPSTATDLDFPPYLAERAQSLAFFDYLNFLLQFCPPLQDDKSLRARFATIGIEPGKPFNPETLPPHIREALKSGIAEGLKAIESKAATGISKTNMLAPHEFMHKSYIERAVISRLGLLNFRTNTTWKTAER